ncbi:MAG: SDR family oxidoreductase [Bryobacteraceae bacterium]
MELGLKGKTALVLGGGSGLGKGIALSLAREGARVAIAGRTQSRLDEAVKEIEAAGSEGLALGWDITDLTIIETQFVAIEKRFGTVDILINNTGGPPPTPAAGQDPELWSKNFQSMILPIFAITDRTLPAMRKKKWGRIITSASSGVIVPIPNLAISNTLRMSLLGWSKTLSTEVAKEGITVNMLLPGRIATDRLRFLDENKAKREGRPLEEVQKESIGTIPVGRYGDIQEYGDTAAFLASELASYITGTVVRVDGGAAPSI